MRRQWRRGRWTVHKCPCDQDFPWTVLLWGGNGLHDADGATFATFGEAFDTAFEAATTTRNVTPWLEER